jgi:phosphatidate cytidylyltransferase
MKKRVLSAIIITAIFLPFLIIGGKPFAIFMSIIGVCGLYELIHIRESKKSFPKLIKVFAYLLVIIFIMLNFKNNDFISNIDYRIVTLVIFLLISPVVFINDQDKYNITDALYLVGAVLFMGLSFNLLIITRNYDINYIIYLLIISVVSDTFALITGSLIGRHKLAPKISPNKTIEGLVGGVFMSTFAAVAFYNTVINSGYSLVVIILITMFLALVSQLGDLVFSSIKRYFNKKDFSDLIPGHGGILDRFDSLIFVTLAFVLFISII